MKIGIDARLINETGVGRYIKNLLYFLSQIDTVNTYIIFLPPTAYDSFELTNSLWQKRKISVRWHSFAEQILLPFFFIKEKLDLLHVPYFTVPLFYPGKIVVTIHDITILNHRTGKSTTLPLLLYSLKWLAYTCILTIGIKKASAVIAVSHAVKEELRQQLHVLSEKIIVTYEGIDPIFLSKTDKKKHSKLLYFLYVGNAYPHKQTEFLIDSYSTFIKRLEGKKISTIPKLIFVGKKDFFYDRLRQKVVDLGLTSSVIFKHDVSDNELKFLYRQCLALVFPSISEGFGLPALEALAQHSTVIVSDIPVFRELLGDYAHFVKHDVEAWCKAFNSVLDNKYAVCETKKIDLFLQRYSWKELSVVTKQIYERSVGVR